MSESLIKADFHLPDLLHPVGPGAEDEKQIMLKSHRGVLSFPLLSASIISLSYP